MTCVAHRILRVLSEKEIPFEVGIGLCAERENEVDDHHGHHANAMLKPCSDHLLSKGGDKICE